MNAFLTGSRVYGKPREDSDIDLVVLMEDESAETLIDLENEFGNVSQYGKLFTNSLKFGNLNLIVCSSKEEFEAWKKGTKILLDECMLNGPVTKAAACVIFENLGLGQDRLKDYNPARNCHCDNKQLLWGGCICGGK